MKHSADTILEIWRLNNYYQYNLRRFLRQYDLNVTEFAILSLLYAKKVAIFSVAELADATARPKQRISHAIYCLLDKQLVVSLEDFVLDGRARMVNISLKGTSLVADIQIKLADFEFIDQEPRAAALWWKQKHARTIQKRRSRLR